MATARESLTQRLHALYLHPELKPYYVLSALDQRVDRVEGRICSDVDLMFQFSLEFWLGGVFKPEKGVLPGLTTFAIGLVFTLRSAGELLPGKAGPAPAAPATSTSLTQRGWETRASNP